MLDIIAIVIGKIIYWVLRKTGRHGAALPGLVVEKIRPNILTTQLAKLTEGVVVISGTNGKTTTTHLIATALKKSGKRVLTNHSGSNMTRGLISSVIRYSDMNGKLPYDIAVLEIDEAYAAKLAPILKPRMSVLTNVLRDQLDRFGEIDTTASLLGKLASHTTKAVIANGLDDRVMRVVNEQPRQKIITYGSNKALSVYFPTDDEWHGSKEKRKNVDCAYSLNLVDGHTVTIGTKQGSVSIATGLSGWHNYLNLTGALATVDAILGHDSSSYFAGIGAPYGRGEEIFIGDKRFVLQLVKNPAGFTTSIQDEKELPALLLINDAFADSRDVSWLWDVDVSSLSKRPTIYCGGSRGYDMALRLKYSELTSRYTSSSLEDSIDEFIDKTDGGILFVTYTAMLRARKYMMKMKSADV